MKYRVQITGVVVSEAENAEEARKQALSKIDMFDKKAEVLGVVQHTNLEPDKCHMGVKQRFG